MSNKGYYTMFYPESLIANSDFVTSSMIMSSQSSTSFSIASNSGLVISPMSSYTVTNDISAYPNNFVSWTQTLTYTSGVNFQTVPQSYLSLVENNYYELAPNLSCTTSGSNTITFSISSYNGSSVPSWVSIDSSTGLVKVSTPSIINNLETSTFYISSTISGITDSINKVITFQVNKWSSQNWQKCRSTSANSCSSWSSGFTVSSSSWVVQQISVRAKFTNFICKWNYKLHINFIASFLLL